MSDCCDVTLMFVERFRLSNIYSGIVDMLDRFEKIVENVLDTKLNFDIILGINNSCKEPCVLTLVSFLVYKEWLMLSLENKFRNNRIVSEYYKHELVLRLKIYERSGKYSNSELHVKERLIDKL